MNDQAIPITDDDLKQLRELIAEAHWNGGRERADLKRLAAELERRVPIASEEVPGNVVTLNSRVRLLDLTTGEPFTCTLVLPSEADIGLYKISILSPIGLAILGRRVGDTVELVVPAGTQRLRIDAMLHRPEAAGDGGR